MALCPSTRPWAAAGSTWRGRSSPCSSAARSTVSIRIAPRRSGAGLSRRRNAGMSSRPRLCGTANAGSGGADPVAIKPIGSAALGHTCPDRFVETVQPEHQNARSHGRRPTSMTITTALFLVENDALIRDLLEASLVSCGTKALAHFDADAARFRAVITDIRLGVGPDGWAVARR